MENNNNFEKTIYGVTFNDKEVYDVVNNILYKTNFDGVYEKSENALKTIFVYELRKGFEKCQKDGYDCREISDNIIDDITEEKALGYWINFRNAFVRDGKPDYPDIFSKADSGLNELYVSIIPKYDPDFGDEKLCRECGHPYVKHFDSWEDYYPCGCKYCSCKKFVE